MHTALNKNPSPHGTSILGRKTDRQQNKQGKTQLLSHGVKGCEEKKKQRRENRESGGGVICMVNEEVRHRFAE